jgi:hypothetical protein
MKTMQSTAQKLYPEQATIPALKIVEKPLYLVGTQVRGYAGGKSWEAFKDDLSALYVADGRWGRFTIWTLEADGPRGLQKKRGGYTDTETGIFHYGSRA